MESSDRRGKVVDSRMIRKYYGMHYLAIGIRKIIARLDYKAYIEIGFTLVQSSAPLIARPVINETTFYASSFLTYKTYFYSCLAHGSSSKYIGASDEH